MTAVALSTLDEISKIGNHFRRATGEVNRWNVGIRQPIDDPINCLARHDLFALRPGVHMAMHAGEITKLAYVDLKDFWPTTTKLQTRGAKPIRESVHVQQHSPPSQHLLFASVVAL